MNKQTRTNVEAIIHRAVQENRRSLDFISLENLDTPWSDLADFRWTLDQIVKAIPDVESLDFSSTPVSDAELLALADKAQQLHHLKSLDFSITGVSDVGLQALAAQAEHLAALQSLNFEHTQVSDAGLIALAEQAQHLPALQSLRFGRTQVGDAGLFVLAEQVKHLHALQLLDFMGTRVSDAGLIALAAQAEHLTKLQALNFMGTQVGNEGLIALAQQAAHLHALQVLNLSWTQVSDEGLIALAQQATHLRALQSLVFWNTEVSDDGLFALAQQAAYLPQLRFLGVLETQVTVPSEILTSCDLARIYEFIVGRERLLPEVKLLLVGQGEAGKTHLRKRLFVEPAETMYHKADEKRTHDIEMTVWSMKVELKQKSGDGKQESKETKVLCRVWDFGGQDELHGSHRFFVGAVRCLYLLVLNATQDAKQNRLDYWLRLLAHHGRKQMGPGEPKRAPVMIVLTQCDTPCDRWGLPGTADNRFVDLINALTVAQRENWYGANVVACIGGFGWSDAVERLTQTQQLEIKQRHTAAAQRIVEELQRHIPDVLGLNSLFPLGFFTMKKWIEDLFTHDPAAPVPDAKYFKWHTNVAFRAMCEEAKISEGLRESYLAICRSLGLVHWVGDIPEIKRGNDADMKEFVFNPEWVKGPVYRLIRSLVAAENRGWMSNERLRARLPAPRKGVKNAPHL